MNTIELNPTAELADKEVIAASKTSLYNRFNKFAESQAKNRAGWFMASLLWQGVLCLPVPAFLLYYYNAPIWVLFITVLLFFINLVAGMAGTKTTTVLGLLIAGTLVNLAMVVAFVI